MASRPGGTEPSYEKALRRSGGKKRYMEGIGVAEGTLRGNCKKWRISKTKQGYQREMTQALLRAFTPSITVVFFTVSQSSSDWVKWCPYLGLPQMRDPEEMVAQEND